LREIPGLGGSDSAHVKGRLRALSARWVGSGVLLLLGGIVWSGSDAVSCGQLATGRRRLEWVERTEV
jgi:predicted transcriptional regulator with HTH domain